MKTLLGMGSLGFLLLLTQGCANDVDSTEVFASSNLLLVEHVGDPCIPSDENVSTFAGYGADEINLELKNDACGEGVCIVNHFQGRVTCPKGSDPTSSVGSTCNTPDGAPVTVTVLPQLETRPASDAVYCSCRCDGPSGAGPFCACPEGFACQSDMTDLAAPSSYAGRYCVKSDTE